MTINSSIGSVWVSLPNLNLPHPDGHTWPELEPKPVESLLFDALHADERFRDLFADWDFPPAPQDVLTAAEDTQQPFPVAGPDLEPPQAVRVDPPPSTCWTPPDDEAVTQLMDAVTDLDAAPEPAPSGDMRIRDRTPVAT